MRLKQPFHRHCAVREAYSTGQALFNDLSGDKYTKRSYEDKTAKPNELHKLVHTYGFTKGKYK